MGDYLVDSAREIINWRTFREMVEQDSDSDDSSDKQEIVHNAQPLPRTTVKLYGTIPRNEQRVYTECQKCRFVFNPRDILSHKTCSDRFFPSTEILEKKLKNKKSRGKKGKSSIPPPPLFKEPPCPPRIRKTSPAPKSSATKRTKPVSVPSPLSTTAAFSEMTISSVIPAQSKVKRPYSDFRLSDTRYFSANSDESSSHSVESIEEPESPDYHPKTKTSGRSRKSKKHKKSRRSNSNAQNSVEYDPDLHCGVSQGSQGPCTRSINCSKHSIHLRKFVPGRSKGVYELIAERKASKDKGLKNGGNYTNGRSDERHFFAEKTIPVASGTESRESAPFVSILSRYSDSSTEETSTTVLTAEQPTPTDSDDVSSNTVDIQENIIEPAPAAYIPNSWMPMKSPEQSTQSNTIPITSNQPAFFRIPSLNPPDIKMFNSHPKPIYFPKFGGMRVGGSIIFKNQHVDHLRNNVLMTIKNKRSGMNNSEDHREMLLLNHDDNSNNVVKDDNRVTCKRSDTEELITSDSKQMRLSPEVEDYFSFQ